MTGRFKPGQSGNPAGRKKGVPTRSTQLRQAIASHADSIIAVLVQQALEGDVQAARVLLERAIPALKPQEQGHQIALPNGTLTDQGRAVLAAVAAGELAPGQGAQLLSGIGTLARVAEIDELDQRIKKLEERRDGKS